MISFFSMYQFQVNCATIMKKRKGDHFMDYADVVETACKTGPDALVKYSNFARYIQLTS